MKKIVFAMTILASTMAIIPANAAPRDAIANAKMFATSPGAAIRIGNQCWKQTDAGRGYGFWTTCNSATIGNSVGSEANSGGTEGGDGGSGGGGDGGGKE